MNSLLDKIQFHLQACIPFVVYSKPGSDVVTGLFQNEEGINLFTDYTQKGFVIAPFEGDKKIIIPADGAEVIQDVTDNI